MVVFLFWFVGFIAFTAAIAGLYKVATVKETKAGLIGGIIGVVLRALTIGWFLVLVYPALEYIK